MTDAQRIAEQLKPDALFSADGRSRYVLVRTWDLSRPVVVFIMLNPSKADDKRDDPTVKRCIAYARAWGFGGLVVVNLFALVSSAPTILAPAYAEPNLARDSEEMRHLVGQCQGRRLVAAWGGHHVIKATGRDKLVLNALGDRRIYCIGPPRAYPPHPLYLPGDLKAEVWRDGPVDVGDPPPVLTTGNLFG